jgi:glucosamine 6-phosphate synthetase-like amidotransferase/phosphosugar isomerase protein
MCGIGAWQLSPTETEFTASEIATVLLRRLSVRGRDAAGLAWHEGDGERPDTFVSKADISGAQFGKFVEKNLGATGICHTRWATKGDPKFNVNNHPIDADGIIGVHNGHVSNDDQLIKLCDGYTRKGKVDSEAAFAMIGHGPKSLGLFGKLKLIKGSAALIWLNAYGPNRYLHAVRITSSPLWFGQTIAGSVILASTEDILRASAKEVGATLDFVYEFDEGEYARFKDGRLVQSATIPADKPYQSKWEMPDYTQPSIF